MVFVDTLHLFPETVAFLRQVEKRYSFEALYYTPKNFATLEAYQEVHGVDLPIRDIQECAPAALLSTFLCANVRSAAACMSTALSALLLLFHPSSSSDTPLAFQSARISDATGATPSLHARSGVQI